MFTNNSKFLEFTPNSLSVVLVKFEDYQSNVSRKMTQSGKHKVYFDIWNNLESVLRLSKNSAKDSVFSRLCHFFCGEYGTVWPFGTVTVK